MPARLLGPEDRFEARRNAMIAFHGRMSDPEEERRESLGDDTRTWGTFREDGTLMASLTDYPFVTWFEGEQVKSGGVSEAATFPEFRGQGAMRTLFEAFLPDAYRCGEILSILCPSSHALYRKFGYGTVCLQSVYTMKPAVLKDYRFEGTAELLEPGDPVAEHTELCNRFAARCNLAAAKTEEQQRKHLGGSYYGTRQFCYLLRDGGKAVAYVQFADDRSPSGSILAVWDLAFEGRRGFEAILGFLSRFDLDYESVELWLPSEIELLTLIRSGRSFEIGKRTRDNLMVRVINAARVLELLKKPASACFTVRIRDPFIAENNGTFRVCGSCAVSVEEEPDLDVSIEAFSQMAAGAVSLREAELLPDATVSGNRDILERIFVRKPIFNTENF